MPPLRDIQSSFENNLRSVQELIDFDHTVLEGATHNIERLRADLDDRTPSVAERVGRTVQMLRNIRDNDSMRSHYATIYNQCVVLLVSHFGSALHSIFSLVAPIRAKCDLEDVKSVLAQVPTVLDPEKESGVEEADAYVLAVAMRMRGDGVDARIVTQEKSDTPTKMSMSTAAGVLGIPCVPLKAFLTAESIVSS